MDNTKSSTPPHRLIGMLHAPALPGSPRYGGDWNALVDFVLQDAQTLASCGVTAMMLENFGDVPFYKGRVPAVTVAAITALATQVRLQHPEVALGINVLRNDVTSALGIAAVVGAEFVRVNVLSGAMLTDQGVIEGQAAEVMRQRKLIGAQHVQVWADVAVKHAQPLASRPLAQEVEELVLRAGADAVIVSGTGTGAPTNLADVREVKAHAAGRPVYVGSGASPETIKQLLEHADGVIAGTFTKTDGKVENPVDADRVNQLLSTL